VLCGEGGDEVFLGYNRQRWAQRMARFKPLLEAVGAGGLVGALPELPWRKWNYGRQLARQFVEGASLGDGYERFFAAVSITTPAVRQRIYKRDFFASHQSRDGFAQRARDYFPSDRRQPLSDLEQFMLGDLTVHLPASLCQRLDRSSMAHSLEARVPFLSHRLVDWALTMPADLKLRGSTGKYVLRKAIEPWLPQGALNQRKIGFQLPFADWFMGGFSDFAREVWRSSGVADLGFLDAAGVEQLFDEHRFLSHRLVDWALTMPADLKLRGSTGKYVLRKAIEPWLPQGALNQRKIGFQLPFADWFMGGFSDFAREAWRSSGVADLGFLDAAGVEQLFDEHRRGGADHGRILYAIAMFSCWWVQQKDSSVPVKRGKRAGAARS